MLEKLANPNRTEKEFVCSVLMDVADSSYIRGDYAACEASKRAVAMLNATPTPNHRPLDIAFGACCGGGFVGLLIVVLLQLLPAVK